MKITLSDITLVGKYPWEIECSCGNKHKLLYEELSKIDAHIISLNERLERGEEIEYVAGNFTFKVSVSEFDQNSNAMYLSSKCDACQEEFKLCCITPPQKVG